MTGPMVRSRQTRSGTLTGKPARQGRTPVNAYGLRGSRFFPVCWKQTKAGKKLGGPQILDRIFAASILRTPSHEDAIKPTLPSALSPLLFFTDIGLPQEPRLDRPARLARAATPGVVALARPPGRERRNREPAGPMKKAEARPKAGAALKGCGESASPASAKTLSAGGRADANSPALQAAAR